MLKSNIVIALLSLLLISCGGSGDGSGSTIKPNIPPTALAGIDRTVNKNTLVTLTGSGTDTDGSISSYSWSQTGGTIVSLNDETTRMMSFRAPDTASSEVLTFKLTVTDNDEATASDSIEVTVKTVNKAPIADDLSLVSDLTTPYIEVQLIGHDADGDIISYVLESDFSGIGYSSAFIENGKNILYITLDSSNGVTKAELTYRVTDSQLFSDSAVVSIMFSEISDSGTGAKNVSAEEYSVIDSAFYDGSNYSTSLNSNQFPLSIDLSSLLPLPGDQGQQSSCVGWAVGYALKSYQEGIEEGWALNFENTKFSPSWIYNQINQGQDNGSLPTDALNLIIAKGAATLSTMPYSQNNYTNQPSQLAINEAKRFKALAFKKIGGIQEAKSALVNHQPVIIGITIYSHFQQLRGVNSVYSSIGTNLGGHAVTAVGYDDNLFGGAFKIINSWGTTWGDNGYFWLPYDEINNVSQAYVLIDAKNDDSSIPIPLAPVRTELPNLQVDSWSISYSGQSGGVGELQYEITNSGNSIAPKGINVGLFLSLDENLNSSDFYVAFEEIPFELSIGGGASRDSSNELPFTFPDNLPVGTYYIGMLVDDLDEVEESYENDNLSWGISTIEIAAPFLPDLAIDSWWLNWNQNGYAELEYSVTNIGTADTNIIGWSISLVAHRQYDITQGYSYFLFSESTPFILESNFSVYRDIFNPAIFSVLNDVNYTNLPFGIYYISFLVDPSNIVVESNDYNNSSISYSRLDISAFGSNSRSTSSTKLVESGRAFNGRNISSSKVATKKVEIIINDKGEKAIRIIEDNINKNITAKKRLLPVESKLSGDKNNPSNTMTKKTNSKNKRIFPTTYKAMPKVEH